MSQFGAMISDQVKETLTDMMEQLLKNDQERETIKLQLQAFKDHERDIYALAKAQGFDVKILKEIFKLVKAFRQGQGEAILSTEQMFKLYRDALVQAGVLPDVLMEE